MITTGQYDLSGGAAALKTMRIDSYAIFVQIITTGATVAGTLQFEVSADGKTWNAFKDADDAVIEFALTTADTISKNYEGFGNAQYIRANVTAGTAGILEVKIT